MATPRDHGVDVQEMSEEDIAKYFPKAVREELTARLKAITPEDIDAHEVLARAARS